MKKQIVIDHWFVDIGEGGPFKKKLRTSRFLGFLALTFFSLVTVCRADDVADVYRRLPDGVNLIRTNPDGSFKSLIVKATADIEEVFSPARARNFAQSTAERQVKRSLLNWMKENINITVNDKAEVTIFTKGTSARDASGNKVVLRNKEGSEMRIMTETYQSYALGIIRGLETVHSEVTSDHSFVLVMGLSQDSINMSKLVKADLDTDQITRDRSDTNGALETEPLYPPTESKTSPDAVKYLK